MCEFTTKSFRIDQAKIVVCKNQEVMGQYAARYVARAIRLVANRKQDIRMIFAAAVSQLTFYKHLITTPDIPWQRITAFQMDEYHSLPTAAPQRFGNFLYQHLYRHRPFGQIHYLKDDIGQYEQLLTEKPIDIVCMGIGENGHLAFNDPPVADFSDQETIKKVTLDARCRHQQVHDGQFKLVDEVPPEALTLTIPTLLNAEYISVFVPGSNKAEAVYHCLTQPVSTQCPASILRTHSQTQLFLDPQSANKVTEIIQ